MALFTSPNPAGTPRRVPRTLSAAGTPYTRGGRFQALEWNYALERQLGQVMPRMAHIAAANVAASAAANYIRTNLRHPDQSSGQLEKDVRQVRDVGLLRALVGSNLVYARIENSGGWIRPVNYQYLAIQERGPEGVPTGDYSLVYRPVHHEGKHYLEYAGSVYAASWPNFARQFSGTGQL